MTAQVAVMNALGVALATDSASSIVRGDDKVAKIYSSDKLFRLSEIAPVAVMISGSTHFLGIPWETVIKSYRKQLGSKTFSRGRGYADDFFRFVQTNKKMFSQSMQDGFVGQLIDALLHDVWKSYCNTSENRPDESRPSIIEEVVAEKLEAEKGFKKIAGFDAAVGRALRTRYGKLIAEKGKDYFGKPISAATPRILNALIAESLPRTNFRSMRTGVVFAGFGEDDYEPVCLEYKVEGMIRNKLRYRLDDDTQMKEHTAAILPFAQSEIVETFLGGVSTEARLHMFEGFGEFVNDIPNVYERVAGQEPTTRQYKQLTSILQEKWGDLCEREDGRQRESWLKTLGAVEFLPQGELAAMAEMLVNLTKFDLRVSLEPETVGGPIDVAIITKGDGFVWVKKKQYYPAELNPHKTGGGAAAG